jgi:hypothetical protein
MAKVLGPLFSLKATGTLGKTLTFQGRAGTTAVFAHKSPYDPKSIGQLAVREYITLGVYYWRHMGSVYQTIWNQFVG